MTVQFAGIVRVNNSTKTVYQSYIDGPASGTLVRSPLWVADDVLLEHGISGETCAIRRRAAVAGQAVAVGPEAAAEVTPGMPGRRAAPLGVPPTPPRSVPVPRPGRRVPATPPARRRHAANSRRLAGARRCAHRARRHVGPRMVRSLGKCADQSPRSQVMILPSSPAVTNSPVGRNSAAMTRPSWLEGGSVHCRAGLVFATTTSLPAAMTS